MLHDLGPAFCYAALGYWMQQVARPHPQCSTRVLLYRSFEKKIIRLKLDSEDDTRYWHLLLSATLI